MSSDRDRILEQALKHELRAAGTAPAGVCLDAETLGAWTDGALAPAAMEAAEAHVASCARCQALVGTMARTTPGTLGSGGTFPLWKWWLAPIAAGVTAVTLWMVVPEQPNVAIAPAERENAAKAAPNANAVPMLPPAQPPAAVDQVGERDRFAAAARDDRQQNKVTEERKEESSAREIQQRAALSDAAVPAAPPAPAAVAAEPLAETVTVQPKERAAAPPVTSLQKNAGAASAIEIATLDPSLGWRIAGDRIERSTDGGKTWTVMRQNSGDGITAGSAPSNSVGWFVGRAGRVLLTTNGGATFTDVSLAEPLDLASVAATDGRSAMVFSVVGRRFRTDDGGRVWRPY